MFEKRLVKEGNIPSSMILRRGHFAGRIFFSRGTFPAGHITVGELFRGSPIRGDFRPGEGVPPRRMGQNSAGEQKFGWEDFAGGRGHFASEGIFWWGHFFGML